MTRRTFLVAGAIPAAGRALPPERDSRSDEMRIYNAINHERAIRGAPQLEWSDQLAQVARDHSGRMLLRRFFGHQDPDYGKLPDRLKIHGVQWSRAGENLFSETGISDPVPIALTAWYYSLTGHFETLMDKGYTHTGVGISATAAGSFCIAQLFLLPPRSSEPSR